MKIALIGSRELERNPKYIYSNDIDLCYDVAYYLATKGVFTLCN